MSRFLYYDFETSGLPEWSLPSGDPQQPHIVQLAAVLCEDGKKRAAIDLIAKPDGWTIPAELTAIHGISNETALTVGVPEAEIVALFWRLVLIAERRVAHNDSFDARIFRIALRRFGKPEQEDAWEKMPRTCTMKATTELCRLPPTARMSAAGVGKFKNPKLEEAYRHLFGEEMQGAHDAWFDVAACRRIHESLIACGTNPTP